MTKEQVQAIVAKATALGLMDQIVVSTDNEYLVDIKSQTSAGYFDHANGLFWGFRTNNHPNRHTCGQEKFLLEAFDYEHIVSITIDIPDAKVFDAAKAVAFDAEVTKDIIQNKIGEHQASNFNKKYDEEGNLINEPNSNIGAVRLS